MRPFDRYVGHGEYLSDHVCDVCGQMLDRCVCPPDQRPEPEDVDDGCR